MDEQSETKTPHALRQHADYLEQLSRELPLTAQTRERLTKVAEKSRVEADKAQEG